ncbi:hypothetical protein [Streptomyces sp. STR69]|uniref:hypothetical protein n=1 Tax=Streptomyces sp. STR69 TaxID=1796942 RepID=UPI0021C7D194|nr:hypothetical protein [Streptomyces sp. STR69]
MHTRGRRLKLTAVLALTVLTLTGFSTGRHHSSSRHRSGSGGGGCSSSSQDHDTSTPRRSNYRSTPTATASGDGNSALGRVTLVSCATDAKPYAVVEVTNPNNRKLTFDISVSFMDKQDLRIEDVHPKKTVPANGTVRVKVKFGGGETGEVLDHCEVDPTALWE